MALSYKRHLKRTLVRIESKHVANCIMPLQVQNCLKFICPKLQDSGTFWSAVEAYGDESLCQAGIDTIYQSC
jgi:hypothetical protein